MYGSTLFRPISGKWDVSGHATTEEVVLPESTINGGVLPKGTWLQHKYGDDSKAVLASGVAVGFTTQDISELGQTSVQAFKDRTIGKMDLPIKVGQAVTLRKPLAGSELEFEGSGAAVPGNLVCTSGTGAIASGTITGGNNGLVPLSVFNGCIRQAQSGEFVNMMLKESALTPENSGYVRIRVVVVQGYILP